MNIRHIELPEQDYYPFETEKKAICIHHTVSGPGVSGDIATFKKPGHVATHFIIERDGTVVQLFDEKYWSHHLAVKMSVFREHGIKYRFDPPAGREFYNYERKRVASNNHWLDSQTIGIELDSWGPVNKQADGSFDHVYERELHEGAEVVMYRGGFRGHTYYEKYYPAQIKALQELLTGLTYRHNIPNRYIKDMWDVNSYALEGGAGIWTHVSYRSDKSDCHPQEELINMLQSLVLGGITS